MENIQCILFNKDIYTPDKCFEWLNNKKINFKKFNITQYHIKFNLKSRIKLQNDGYIMITQNEDDGNIKMIMAYKPNPKNAVCNFKF
jgi:hypothetical protein